MRISEDQLHKLASEDVKALNPHLFPPSHPAGVISPKRNKYGARKTEVEGHIFDSKAEAQRYRELRILEREGLITDLQRQVQFILQEGFVDADGKRQHKISYSADFTYRQGGQYIIEDVKSPATSRSEAFRVRWRLLLNSFKDNAGVRCVLTS